MARTRQSRVSALYLTFDHRVASRQVPPDGPYLGNLGLGLSFANVLGRRPLSDCSQGQNLA